MTIGDAEDLGPSDARSVADLIAQADLDGARRAILGTAVRTPTLASVELTEAAGAAVALKAECLQGTGSFKLRGALSKLAALGERAAPGVVTASAGNHARALARAARLTGVGCEVFMPRDASVSKVAAVQALGASVELEGASVDEALGLAHERSRQTGAALVHPFDDLDVIAGQGTLVLELLEDVPDLARVVVPVGGGGLASGVGIALRRAGAEVELVGVQARTCAPYVQALSGAGAPDALQLLTGATIADGIAVKHPGALTLPLLRELLDEMLAGLLLRHETEEGRRVRIFTRVPDRPGGLAELLDLVAQARANLLSVEHQREALPLHVRETGVQLTLETRGREHTEQVLAALAGAGYEVTTA